MSNRTKIIIAVIALAASFLAGKYTTPAKVVTEIKTVEVEKKVEQKDVEKEKHKKTVIVKNKDGSSTTTITDDSASTDRSKTTDDVAKRTDEKKEVTRDGALTSISILAGLQVPFDPSTTLSQIKYGIHVHKEILGPITVGAFGFTDRTFGLSMGLNL